MTTVGNFMSKLVKNLPKMEGSKGTVTLGCKQLEAMGEHGKEVAEAMRCVDASTLDVAYKAKSNYSIAGFRLKNGQKVVGNGAVSLENPGAQNSVMKYRVSLGENGRTMTSNGFFDAGKHAPADDMSMAISRKGGKISGHAEVGDAATIHLAGDEKEIVNVLGKNQYGGKEAVSNYQKAYWALQQKFDEVYTGIGKILRGKGGSERSFDYVARVYAEPKDPSTIGFSKYMKTNV